jgi:hypothetical protein
MDVTFLCQIRLPDNDPGSLPGISEDIQDELLSAGYDVLSVRPWTREGVSAPTADLLAPPTEPGGLFL